MDVQLIIIQIQMKAWAFLILSKLYEDTKDFRFSKWLFWLAVIDFILCAILLGVA